MSDDRSLLLVDDDETTRDLLNLMLGAEGWHVADAPDGDVALAILNSEETMPAVVLTDLRMPGLNGTAMADAIRTSAATKGVGQIPLLLAMTATATEGIPAGFDDLLIKPFAPEEVLRRCTALWDSGVAAQTETVSDSIEDADAIETSVFEKLRSSMTPDQLRSLYEFALNDTETRVQRMKEASAAGDDTRYRSEAHAIKGSCGMIGAVRLRNLAAGAEADGLQTQNTLIESKPLTEFVKGIAQIRHMLERLLPR